MAKARTVTPAEKASWSKVRIDKGPRTLQLVGAKKAVRDRETLDDRIDLTFAEADDLEGPVVGITVNLPTKGQVQGGFRHLGRVCDALRMLGADDENGVMPTSVDGFADAIGRKVNATILHAKDESGETIAKVEHGTIKAADDK